MNEPRFEVFPETTAKIDPIHGPEDVKPTGNFVWHFKDANGHITLTGGEAFSRREDAHRSIRGACEDVAVVLGARRGEKALAGARDSVPIIDLDENGELLAIADHPGPPLDSLPKGTDR